MLEDSKNETQNRLDIENRKISNKQQNTRDIEKYDDKNPFDFSDIEQHNDEISLNELLDLAENIKTKYGRTPVFDVIIDSQRVIYPFIKNGDFIINDGEPFQVNRFYKDSDQLSKSIEKTIDKYDETIQVLFSGYMINHTMVFKQTKRSNYG